MNFKKDVLEVIEVDVFSPTPWLLILPRGMLCCVEMGFLGAQATPLSMGSVFIHCICMYLLSFLVAFLLVPGTTCRCLGLVWVWVRGLRLILAAEKASHHHTCLLHRIRRDVTCHLSVRIFIRSI